MTIAMQGARPMMIDPIAYSGLSGNSSTAKANISTGPTTQFSSIEMPNSLLCRATLPICSYFTLTSGGYIITINPSAIGHEIVPVLIDSNTTDIPGNRYPRPTPNAIAKKIHSVKYRSKKDSPVFFSFSI